MADDLRRNKHDLLRADELLGASDEFQRMLAAEGLVPDVDKLLLRRYRVCLQFAAGALLGLTVSVLALLANFVVFNMLIHIER